MADVKGQLAERIERDGLYPIHVAVLLGISVETASSLVEQGRGALPSHIIARLPEHIELLDQLNERHGKELRSWLLRPHPALDGRRPLDLIASSNGQRQQILELD